MPKRFTETNKWDDKWYRALKPEEKLVFNFICDKCDLAGFYEIDLDDMEFRIGYDKDIISGAIQGLNRGYLKKDNVIWIKRFLVHQRNLPLNTDNNAHKHIFYCINKRIDDFPEIPSILKIDRSMFRMMNISGAG